MFLDGVRILELTIGWAGPFAGLYLGDLGAEVVHIEGPASRGLGTIGVSPARLAEEQAAWSWGQLAGPAFRAAIFPDADPGEHPWNRGGHVSQYNRNKLSLCMDMKHPDSRQVFLDLVRVSDVVLSNFSPEGQRHLGLDHAELVRHNPMIILVHLTGYGLTGPAAPRRSWGPILEGHTGMAAATGYDGEPPMKMGVALPDAIGGLHGAAAVLGALRHREELGHGFAVDVSQLETYASYAGEHYLAASVTGDAPRRQGNRSADAVPQGVYRCVGDDEWVAVSVETDEEWEALRAVISPRDPRPHWATRAARQAAHDEIDDVIGAWTAGRPKFDAMHALQAAGVRAAACLTNAEVVEDPHLTARGFMVEWDQVDVGRRRFMGSPIHVSDGDTMPVRATAALGADNAYVLTEILGYPKERVEELTDLGAITTRPPEAEAV